MTMITPSYLGETIEYSSLHACRSTLEDPTTRASGIVFAALFTEAGSETPSGAIANAVKEVFRFCALPENGAQAMLEWGPPEMKTSAEVVWGSSRPDFELMGRVKKSFDPQNVLAPGRFAGGI